MVLHGCNGVGPHYREWARRLAGWGFVALLIDSFGPRGFREVCNRGRDVPPEAQARDAFDGAAYQCTAPEVHAARVGVIGFSQGGWAVLKAVLAGLVRRPDEPAFDAAIAYYPGCDPPTSTLETDTLILISDADDWTLAARCARWRDTVETNGHTLRMKIFPGARHAFAVRSPPHSFAGHFIGQDLAAMAVGPYAVARIGTSINASGQNLTNGALGRRSVQRGAPTFGEPPYNNEITSSAIIASRPTKSVLAEKFRARLTGS